MSILNTKQFYDALAPEYDTMTEFEQRYKKEQSHFRKLITQYNIHSAIDAGCGTGFHTFLLASLGVSVTSVDVSEEMLKKLQHHANEMQLPVNILNAKLEELQGWLPGEYDAIFCLGNTLAHLQTAEILVQTLLNFKQKLGNDGTLVLQILNYERILNNRERIQNIKERDGKMYIRFYDFLEERIAFNILTVERQDEVIHHKLQTTALRPLRYDDIAPLLKEAGFNEINSYGGISLTPFDEHSSSDLVLIAR